MHADPDVEAADLTPLREHLLGSRIAGDVVTPREENLRNFSRMAEGRTNYDFGLVPSRPYTRDEVLEVMARLCGVHPDPAYERGPDTIDVELCLAALADLRDRLALAARRRERVLLATGHPTGILAIHLDVAGALRRAGCAVLVPEVPWSWPWDGDSDWARGRPRHVRAVNGVHLLASGGELLHTHLPEPMRAVLAALHTAGEAPPDLVFADHGWAGAAAAAGLETLAFADCNDPALFVAEAEGLPLRTVPLDDNVLPHLYDPLSAYLVSGWGDAGVRAG
ncbi:MAG: phosphatase [Actinomycetota bacterium]|nr:phosphatase [Actinomycetota bacterium]